ncbi:Hypothetical_protein [Hexamita inflata]|uniref:Hypothetical_protein n=1 Tax=Hexamita inflata TaxID=28002 RepID=A0AA86NDX8_9EUKA|nr:Hypothetical protein HINF_LOCUS4969 [Hexamita inflata]CAI9931159.1 Hypothetical protein HINF_LOCUS18804 [Hexamita inflata]
MQNSGSEQDLTTVIIGKRVESLQLSNGPHSVVQNELLQQVQEQTQNFFGSPRSAKRSFVPITLSDELCSLDISQFIVLHPDDIDRKSIDNSNVRKDIKEGKLIDQLIRLLEEQKSVSLADEFRSMDFSLQKNTEKLKVESNTPAEQEPIPQSIQVELQTRSVHIEPEFESCILISNCNYQRDQKGFTLQGTDIRFKFIVNGQVVVSKLYKSQEVTPGVFENVM